MREYKQIKIAVAGAGYVGLSMAVLLSQHHDVVTVDIVEDKVKKINGMESPIQDEYIEKYLKVKPLSLTATLDGANAYKDAAKNDGHVVAANVKIKTAICPECGRSYVAGGLTTTQIKYDKSDEYSKSNKELIDDAAKGNNLDYSV